MSICLLVAPFARDARGVLSTSVQVVAGARVAIKADRVAGGGGGGGVFPPVRAFPLPASKQIADPAVMYV